VADVHRCEYAVVEATSEGLAQNRHFGISFDMAIFTNLSKAHLDSHGGFENYKKAKGKLFQALGKRNKKLEKTIVVNLDDESTDYFLSFKAKKKVGVSLKGKSNNEVSKIYSAIENEKGFELEGKNFEVKLFGKFNIQNAVLAVAVANVLGVSLKDCVRAILSFTKIRGRMERVENGRGISIFVDYGCEPATMKAALLAVKNLSHKKIIHIFGSTGGHRDIDKRFEFGKISAQLADQIIITNDDVYESDPQKIAEDIEKGIIETTNYKQQTTNKSQILNYKIILDRRDAIHRALEIAEEGDILLITGKGSEQFLVLPGDKRIVWDDVSVVKEELQKISNN